MCPGFDSRTWRHMWVEFVVGSLLCSERFFSGYSGFPLSLKNMKKQARSFLYESLWTRWCSVGKQIAFFMHSLAFPKTDAKEMKLRERECEKSGSRRGGGGGEASVENFSFLTTPSPFSFTPPHFSLIFCSPQACFPPRKQREAWS